MYIVCYLFHGELITPTTSVFNVLFEIIVIKTWAWFAKGFIKMR